MPLVEFEPTIPLFERSYTVHALARVAGHCDRQLVGTDVKYENVDAIQLVQDIV
jgi:hypothetical protein